VGVTAANGGRRRGRIVIGESDPSLVRYAGLAVTGELARRLRLVELVDAELSVERRARPVKVRRRGLSPGQLVVALSECQLVGGEFFSDLEEVRADQAGSGLRTVAATPSAPTVLQRAKDFRRVHCQRVERACARVGEHLDRALGRERTEPVTIDLDATGIEVYGRRKQGAARNRHGQLSYAPHVAFWAERGRALTSELVGGNREKLTDAECARIATRALSLLPAGHGPATFRIDSAYYQLELLQRLRREDARFTVSVPRSQAMWKALAEIGEDAWQEALDMPGAQVAETSYRPDGWNHEPLRLIIRRVPFTAEEIAKRKGSRRLKTIHPEQLQLVLDGQIDSVYGHSFHRHPLAADCLDRALPPPPRPDRGTPQGVKARPGAAPPTLRRRARQPRVADRRATRAQPNRVLLRPLSRRGRVGQGARRRAAAPCGQNASQPDLQHPRADRAHRPAADPAPTRRLPTPARLPGDTRRDLRARALTPKPTAR
jgi:hypothetical protein